MDSNVRELIFRAVDQTISPEDFERLQTEIERSPDVRAEYLRAINLCQSLGEIASEPTRESFVDTVAPRPHKERWYSKSGWLLATAAMLFVVSSVAFWLGLQKGIESPQERVAERVADDVIEARLAGHATLRRVVDVKWSEGAVRRLEGDVLPKGAIAFDEGVAEIDLFCGATLIFEGPAELEIESDWSVRVTRGRMRATVPPAARGFVVKASESEIVDLGTEFALEVGTQGARVEVIDGEVKLRGGTHDGKHLRTGETQSLGGGVNRDRVSSGLSTSSEIGQRQQLAETQRFDQWKVTSNKLRSDPRMIAYFPIAESQEGRVVRNASRRGKSLDGLLVGPVERTSGRFGPQSAGLEFDRPGARVRTRLDGTFDAFTFTCWVRIDSLEHRYNALFMSDGYETGEPHWQIRDDGRLMFSVMVDDTQDVRFYNRRDQRVVKDAGKHRVYYTDPFWDISKSGQWFHLAAVYSPAERSVNQYINGDLVASDEITDEFLVSPLRIGAAEIGNWGQPFRSTQWFAVRNLNGTIDELAFFGTPLTANEINSLYQQGKPLGY
ncbi:MAG: LamG-like jellyroll fold domain-containing protein [Planctomycetota bacterium]